ncbi:MAG: hypothetical protein ABEJ90_03830 [Halobacterium sp.]
METTRAERWPTDRAIYFSMRAVAVKHLRYSALASTGRSTAFTDAAT